MQTETLDTLDEASLLAAEKRLNELKVQQNALREEELKIREYIADALFNEEQGSKTFTYGSIKVNVKRELRFSISKDDAERLSKEYPKKSLEILSWSPNVKVSGFRAHEDIAAEYITSKQGPPTITFKR